MKTTDEILRRRLDESYKEYTEAELELIRAAMREYAFEVLDEGIKGSKWPEDKQFLIKIKDKLK